MSPVSNGAIEWKTATAVGFRGINPKFLHQGQVVVEQLSFHVHVSLPLRLLLHNHRNTILGDRLHDPRNENANKFRFRLFRHFLPNSARRRRPRRRRCHPGHRRLLDAVGVGRGVLCVFFGDGDGDACAVFDELLCAGGDALVFDVFWRLCAADIDWGDAGERWGRIEDNS